MSGLERQADTLSPLVRSPLVRPRFLSHDAPDHSSQCEARPVQVRVPFYDDTITRVKADALLYDEDSFSWFVVQAALRTLCTQRTCERVFNSRNSSRCVLHFRRFHSEGIVSVNVDAAREHLTSCHVLSIGMPAVCSLRQLPQVLSTSRSRLC